MATPPEACFPLLFQWHLERNGGDYIPPCGVPVAQPSPAPGNTPLTVMVHAALLPRLAVGKP